MDEAGIAESCGVIFRSGSSAEPPVAGTLPAETNAALYLRRHRRAVNGVTCEYWTLVESRRTVKEFGRTKDVERIFSVKRGTLDNAEKLALSGASCSGCADKKSGVKLWDMRSIENRSRGEMVKP